MKTAVGRHPQDMGRTTRVPKEPYKDAIARNLPIGSGEIESAHRYVIQKRLKLSGAWWTLDNAAAVLALRVARANGRWLSYWQRCRQAAA
jgi:hypothetical protein